jgi:hypothetical protein
MRPGGGGAILDRPPQGARDHLYSIVYTIHLI